MESLKKILGRVVREQEELREQSFLPRNFVPALDRKITLAEVIVAIERLKLAKSAGQDEIVAEVLKRGGDSVNRAVWVLCCKVWREENCLPTGPEELFAL